jgi:hypothetical protein
MLFAGAPAYGEPGAVYVFERDGHGVWRLVQTLSSGDGVNSDYFGAQIAVSGESLAIGAPGEAQGAVFVYERRGNRWIERQKLVAGDEQSGQFGAALALSQDRLVIGAAGADFDPSGLCGPPDAAGAVYVFALAAGEWTQQQKIPTPVPHCTFNFGVTVAVDRHVLVGATPSTFPYTVGGVYAYKRQGASYVPLAGALDSSSDSTPILGLSGCTLMMGLPFDRGFSTGTVEVFDACGTSNSTAAPAADVASSGAQ